MSISENSRVWIYQSDRAFNPAEEASIKKELDAFTGQWHAHEHALAAKAEIKYHRFIILMVDESQVGASGCSIDKSVHFMKELEQKFNLNLFDRFNIAFRKGDEVTSCSRTEFEKLLEEGKIDENTLVFNNLVPTLADLRTSWEIPFKESWHARIFSNLIKN